jgi:hypothetical protein
LYSVSSKGVLEDELKSALLEAVHAAPSHGSDRPTPKAATPSDRLRELQKLRDAELIGQKEYDSKRAEILKEF